MNEQAAQALQSKVHAALAHARERKARNDKLYADTGESCADLTMTMASLEMVQAALAVALGTASPGIVGLREIDATVADAMAEDN